MLSVTSGEGDELAPRTAITTETARFYEPQGLIPAPEVPPGGYRDYPDELVDGLEPPEPWNDHCAEGDPRAE